MALTATQSSAAFLRPAPLVRHRIPRRPVLVARRVTPLADSRDPWQVAPDSLAGRLILAALRLIFVATELGFALALLSLAALAVSGLGIGQ
jgi:hypothetical protein